jgi:hypothetical protein
MSLLVVGVHHVCSKETPHLPEESLGNWINVFVFLASGLQCVVSSIHNVHKFHLINVWGTYISRDLAQIKYSFFHSTHDMLKIDHL